MRETGMVIECEGRQHKFLLGLTDDGYRDCPICSKPLLQPRNANSANEIYGMETIGQAWRKKRKPLSISVDMDTNKMQLKLRAIAKHAEQLAEELEAIENIIECPKCGGCEVCEMYANEKLYHASCNDCGHVIVDDLPTRIEGSE